MDIKWHNHSSSLISIKFNFTATSQHKTWIHLCSGMWFLETHQVVQWLNWVHHFISPKIDHFILVQTLNPSLYLFEGYKYGWVLSNLVPVHQIHLTFSHLDFPHSSNYNSIFKWYEVNCFRLCMSQWLHSLLLNYFT